MDGAVSHGSRALNDAVGRRKIGGGVRVCHDGKTDLCVVLALGAVLQSKPSLAICIDFPSQVR